MLTCFPPSLTHPNGLFACRVCQEKFTTRDYTLANVHVKACKMRRAEERIISQKLEWIQAHPLCLLVQKVFDYKRLDPAKLCSY
jgi:hypothetical protein